MTPSGSGERGPVAGARCRDPLAPADPGHSRPPISAASCHFPRQPVVGLVSPPLCGSADALALVAGPAGRDQVDWRGLPAPCPRVDVVNLGGLAAAVFTNPSVAIEDRATENRVNAALGRIGRGRVPVQERVGS